MLIQVKTEQFHKIYFLYTDLFPAVPNPIKIIPTMSDNL